MPYLNCCLHDSLAWGCNYFPCFWQDVNCDTHRAQTYPKTQFYKSFGRKTQGSVCVLILTPSFVFGCLFIFILLADYAQKVVSKKCELFYSVIIINGFLGIVLPSFLSLRVYRDGEQFIISHIWAMVVGMLISNSFTGEIEVTDFL